MRCPIFGRHFHAKCVCSINFLCLTLPNPYLTVEVIPLASLPTTTPMETIDVSINLEHSSSTPKSFSEVVSHSTSAIGFGARFHFHTPNRVSGFGKSFVPLLSSFSISPNKDMLHEIVKENNRLKYFAIFFATIDANKCPPHKFLDDWFHNYWNLKKGLPISFRRRIQSGLFFIFFNSSEAQQVILKK